MDLFVEIENVFQLKNYCRLCALYYDDEALVQISEYNLITSSTHSDIMDASSFLEKSLDIRIDHDSPLPKQICQHCLDVLIKFYQFKIKCHNSEIMLKSIINDVPFEEKSNFLFEENVFTENLDPFNDVLDVNVMHDIANTENESMENKEFKTDQSMIEKQAIVNSFVCLDCREVIF